MLIDSHAHLDSERYADDREALLRRAWQAGVTTILSIGIGEHARGMGRALQICREFNQRKEAGTSFPRLYASAGVYPHNTPEIDGEILTELDRLLSEPEVIACGEIGLDYYHEGAAHAVQQEMLIAQLEIAARRQRPILIHCRPKDAGVPSGRPSSLGWKDGQTDAWDDLFAILDIHWRTTGLGGILHCFGGTLEQAQRGIEMGFLVSFAGNLTYPKAQPMRDVAARLPLDSLLVETDAPWLAPAPYRGQRNEPALMAHTAGVMAGLRGLSVEEIAAVTRKNFQRLFRLGADVGNC